jgi:hypothetical protein
MGKKEFDFFINVSSSICCYVVELLSSYRELFNDYFDVSRKTEDVHSIGRPEPSNSERSLWLRNTSK